MEENPKIVKLCKNQAVNPKHVIAVLIDKNDLKTYALIIGGIKVPSDHTFDETVKILNGESIIATKE